MSDNNNNILFFLEEKITEQNNSAEIEKMLYELEDNEDIIDYNLDPSGQKTDVYYFTKKMYDDRYGANNEEFYKDYTVKQLLRICDYYDIEKNVKVAKYKKQDIISSIVYFESFPENAEIVNNRHKMWSYITEMLHDTKMKKYIIWN